MTDDLTLVINNLAYTGWKAIRVTRSCERFPSDFDINLTQKDPSGKVMPIRPFDQCQVFLGDDLVLTGYIDVVESAYDPNNHTVTISGRSLCEDLVDCSAEFGGPNATPVLQVSNVDVMQIATKIAGIYGIGVKKISTQPFTMMPQFKITPGETGYEIIERIARYQNVLVYDDTDGNLVLADIGYAEHASGFAQGQNIQAANLCLRFDQRFSNIDVFDHTVYSMQDIQNAIQPGVATDSTIRHRRLITLTEIPAFSGVSPQEWRQKRATWEMNRRIGRSQVVRLTTDSWRDKAGQLWQPNHYVTVDAPNLGVSAAKWIIADVTFSKDDQQGTLAHLTILPPLAFSIEPTVAVEFDPALLIGAPGQPAPITVSGHQ